jgi:lysophospholipase L1-like esterase
MTSLRLMLLAILLAWTPWTATAQESVAGPADGDQRRVVFIGDSLTAAWPSAHDGLCPGDMINRGVGGETAARMRARFQRELLSAKPTVVHIMGGTNDIAGNGGRRSQSALRADIAAMATMAQKQGVPVVLASIPPATGFFWAPAVKPQAPIVALNAWMEDYAERQGFVFADYHAVLAAPDGGLKREYTTDGVHLNEAGYAAIDPVACAAILEAEAR